MLLLSMYNPRVYAKAGLLYLLYSNVHINSGVYLLLSAETSIQRED
jgi:hypothetical protein